MQFYLINCIFEEYSHFPFFNSLINLLEGACVDIQFILLLNDRPLNLNFGDLLELTLHLLVCNLNHRRRERHLELILIPAWFLAIWPVRNGWFLWLRIPHSAEPRLPIIWCDPLSASVPASESWFSECKHWLRGSFACHHVTWLSNQSLCHLCSLLHRLYASAFGHSIFCILTGGVVSRHEQPRIFLFAPLPFGLLLL